MIISIADTRRFTQSGGGGGDIIVVKLQTGPIVVPHILTSSIRQ
jgi:uncharacterized protein (UPF0261 family)